MMWNIEETWREAIAPSTIGGGSRGLLSQVCYSEGKKYGRSQGKRESWKKNACEEEEEKVGILPTTLGWGTSKGRSFEEHWRIPDYRIQT